MAHVGEVERGEQRMPTRRETLGAVAGAAWLASDASAARAADDGPVAALTAFLRAFENCDLPRMEAAFADDATSFDRAPPGPLGDFAPYRRAPGMPAGMREIARTLPQRVPGPPYHRVQPDNLACQIHGDIALCTFELDGIDNLGRRTVILIRQARGWKILHIHASNLYRGTPAAMRTPIIVGSAKTG
jgi:ketosteroid isomerase-like protein